MKQRRRRRNWNRNPLPEFGEVTLTPQTTVLGMDPTKLGGCVVSGIVEEVGVDPSYSFDVSRDRYFHLSGVTGSSQQLEHYTTTHSINMMQNAIHTSKTPHPILCLEWLIQIARYRPLLLEGYSSRPLWKDKWDVTVT